MKTKAEQLLSNENCFLPYMKHVCPITLFCKWRLNRVNFHVIYKKSFQRQLHNTWINKSRDWHINGVANKSSVWFFMSTNLQKIPVGHESIRIILNDFLGMKRVDARLVPKDHLTRLSLWTNFWPKTQRISSNNHHIHLIWLRSTFFSFQNSNYHFEAPVFSR